MLSSDEKHLRRAIELARMARDHGNRPFGAVIADREGKVVAEAEADSITRRDCTGHAETNALRLATPKLPPNELAGCTMYASSEPCVMCAGAIFWANIRRVVYGVDSVTLRRYRGERRDQADLRLSCREVFRASAHNIEVLGPQLEPEALVPHEGYWK